MLEFHLFLTRCVFKGKNAAELKGPWPRWEVSLLNSLATDFCKSFFPGVWVAVTHFTRFCQYRAGRISRSFELPNLWAWSFLTILGGNEIFLPLSRNNSLGRLIWQLIQDCLWHLFPSQAWLTHWLISEKRVCKECHGHGTWNTFSNSINIIHEGYAQSVLQKSI